MRCLLRDRPKDATTTSPRRWRECCSKRSTLCCGVRTKKTFRDGAKETMCMIRPPSPKKEIEMFTPERRPRWSRTHQTELEVCLRDCKACVRLHQRTRGHHPNHNIYGVLGCDEDNEGHQGSSPRWKEKLIVIKNEENGLIEEEKAGS